MKVIDHLNQKKERTLFSFEILPPLKGKSIHSIFDVVDPLMEYKPSFVNVTYHRSEYLYKKREDGSFEKVVVRKRPGTVAICAALMNKYGVDAVPHIICGGFTKDQTEDALIDLHFLGIDNILALRGDAAKSENSFIPEPGGNAFALDLVQQVQRMNEGIYLEDDLSNGHATNFCIGVAGYPEKHFEAPNLDIDLQHLKAKVDAGAEYIVTQLFFNNQKYFDFVDKCRAAGITIPIIPGLKPLTKRPQLFSVPKSFYVDIPNDLVESIKKASDADVKKIGVEWCIAQSKELIERGAPCVHYYVMNNAPEVSQIAKAVL